MWAKCFFFINARKFFGGLSNYNAKNVGKWAPSPIAFDKALFFSQKDLLFFLFLEENICCGYSLEAPWLLMSTRVVQKVLSLIGFLYFYPRYILKCVE